MQQSNRESKHVFRFVNLRASPYQISRSSVASDWSVGPSDHTPWTQLLKFKHNSGFYLFGVVVLFHNQPAKLIERSVNLAAPFFPS
jgi:hypothetical protein